MLIRQQEQATDGYKKDRNKEDGFTHSRWDGI